MVTGIRKGAVRRPYIDKWFAYRQVNDTTVANRLGVDRTTVWKWRKFPGRLDPGKMDALATALDIDPKQLWELPPPPGPPPVSLDALVKDADDDLKAMAADIVRRLVAGGR